MIKLKAPRIYHLPWSEVVSKDDKFIRNKTMFNNKQILVTIKNDGENVSLYNDGSFHARSITSGQHETRSWLYDWWAKKLYSNSYLDIHNKWPNLRLVGENMYAKHTIKYNNLKDVFLLHSAWENSTCLSWKDTLYIANVLDISCVYVLYQGLYNESIIRNYDTLEKHNYDLVEGYVVRNSESYNYLDSDNNIAKFVSNRFINANSNDWFYSSIERNNILKCT